VVVALLSGALMSGALMSGGLASGGTPPPLKPVIGGVLDRKGMPAQAQWGAIDAFVVTATWAQLQPTNGGPLATDNPIDQALAAVRAPGGPSTMKLKLRIPAGINAPEWAKHLGGEPVPMVFGNKQVTVGRFWTAAFGQAYQDLQTKLAARYDAVPEIAQTEISRCTTFWTEPYWRQWQKDVNRRPFLEAGYTAAADDQCHTEEIEAHAVWARTRSGLAFAPFWRMAPDGTTTYDEAYTEQMMRSCRSVLGRRCVLENYSLRWPLLSGLYDQMYAAMKTLGPPLAFQTANPAKVGDWAAALNWAADIGTNSVELNMSYPTYDPTKLGQARARLAANPG